MNYGSELKFLCDVLKKSGINVIVSPKEAPIESVYFEGLEYVLSFETSKSGTLAGHLGDLERNTVYKMTGSYKFSSIYFLLPDSNDETVIFIGPYRNDRISLKSIMSEAEQRGLPPKRQKQLEYLYGSLPVVSDNSHLHLLLDTFYERIWGSNSFYSVEIGTDHHPVSPINKMNGSDSLDDIILNMTAMEKRYEYENELMRAVSNGQINKINFLSSAVNESIFEKRVSDPLRNMKNYCIIMNTLLRKAAENGGVHPLYINSVSTAFAVRIEQIISVNSISELMQDMFRSYCRLVRKHSMKNYTPLVQNTIIFIESDLSADLSLSKLAKAQKVSAGYLSTVFKREVGKTVIEYIREKRIEHAMHLLRTTHFQVQTVAIHCGIMDLQYFSKQFKRETGMTPKEYRESLKQ